MTETAAGTMELPARLGVVIAKRFIASAVRRNLLKRLARENFRLLRQQLPSYDLVLRLAARPQNLERRVLAGEIRGLLEKLRDWNESGAGVEKTGGQAKRRGIGHKNVRSGKTLGTVR